MAEHRINDVAHQEPLCCAAIDPSIGGITGETWGMKHVEQRRHVARADASDMKKESTRAT